MTYRSVVARWGNVVSLTQTLLSVWSSRVVAPGTGILMNGIMIWFDPGSVANANAPGKRPLANVSPVLVLDEEQAHLSLGATAGRTIIAALPQIVSTVVEHGMGDPAGHQRAQSRLQRAADAGWQPDRSSSG